MKKTQVIRENIHKIDTSSSLHFIINPYEDSISDKICTYSKWNIDKTYNDHVISCPFLAMLLYLCCIQIPFPCLEFLKRRKIRRRQEEREGRWRGLTDSTLAKKDQKLSWSRAFLPTTQCSLLSSTLTTPLGVNCSFPPFTYWLSR